MFAYKSIRTRLYLAVATGVLLSAGALAAALLQLDTVGTSFRTFIHQDLALLRAYTDMYAQGLQSGQALRNIALDPANRQAYDNLDAGNAAFARALESARQLVKGDAAGLALLEEVDAGWKANLQTKQKVLGMIGSSREQAIKVINESETPSWRKVRGSLLKSMEAKEKEVAALDARTAAAASFALRMCGGLGAMALLIACAMSVFATEGTVRAVLRLKAGIQALSAGDADLTKRLDVVTRDEVGQASLLFNTFMDRMQTLVNRIRTSATQVSGSSDALQASSREMAQSLVAQSDSTSAMAATLEQLTVSIDHLTAGAAETRNLSAAYSESARSGAGVVSQASNEIEHISAAVADSSMKIQALNTQSDLITSIVNTIREIAGQTNLLALNAAIEAARAGDQGRGFAIVADEVRKLAERTTDATNEISRTVDAIKSGTQDATATMGTTVSAVDTGVACARRAADALTTIVDNSRQVDATVAEMTGALKEQSTATHDLARNVERIVQMAQANEQSVRQSVQTADRLQSAAADLNSLIASFKSEPATV